MLVPDSVVELDTNALDLFLADDVNALKPDAPLCVDESATVAQVVETLRAHKRGAVAVLRASKELAGIFTERDLVKRVYIPELDPETTPVGSVMTRSPQTVYATSSVALVFELLSAGGYRHLPVVSPAERVIGMVSVRQLLLRITESVLSVLSTAS